MSDTKIPQDLLYTESHEWLKVDGEIVTIGITDHAQHELGDIVFVELPDVGQKLEAGKGLAVIEAVKTVADVYAPANGEVIAVNDALASSAATINEDAYGNGWIAKIKLTTALPKLLTASEYEGQL